MERHHPLVDEENNTEGVVEGDEVPPSTAPEDEQPLIVQEQDSASDDADEVPSNPSSPSSTRSASYDDDENVLVVDAGDLLYGIHSFHTIMKPVTLSMILSALSVTFVTTREWQSETQNSLTASYTVLRPDEDDNGGLKLFQSLVNGLIIVGFICALTFMIVLLYKYRCIKVLLGYLMLASIMMLGLLSADMLQVFVERYEIPVDKITFWLAIFNFAITGVVSIFLGQGTPVWCTQGYLVATSVILAWRLSQLDDWTTWTLLFLLALYDLVAVLTPCGPLKALVKLMQGDDAPALPGLLYESRVVDSSDPEQRRRGRRRQIRPTTTTTSQGRASADNTRGLRTPPRSGPSSGGPPREEAPTPFRETPPTPIQTTRSDVEEARSEQQEQTDTQQSTMETVHGGFAVTPSGPWVSHEMVYQTTSNHENDNDEDHETAEARNEQAAAHEDTTEPMEQPSSAPRPEQPLSDAISHSNRSSSSATRNNNNNRSSSSTNESSSPVVTRIPLALAILYKLPLVDDPHPPWRQRRRPASNTEDWTTTDAPSPRSRYTVAQLTSLVDAVVPRQGGRIIPRESPPPSSSRNSSRRGRGNNSPTNRSGSDNSSDTPDARWAVLDRNGDLRRVLVVNSETGSIYEEHTTRGAAGRKGERESIRLGLGDFVFYSILVAKAALFSWATFVACVLVILVGLGTTMMILAIRQQALPALPVSIFLGIMMYLLVRYVIHAWIEEIFTHATYV